MTHTPALISSTCLALLAGACAPAGPAAPASPALASAQAAGSAPAAPAPRGPYLGQTAGPLPKIFAPGVVSRRYQELNAAFSPAGDELFFTIADPRRREHALLHTRRLADGTWTTPGMAPFSGAYSDADPFFSFDGQRVYFISKRPRPGAASRDGRLDFNLWYAERRGAGWAEPVDLGAAINSPTDEFYVSLTRDGAIYSSTADGKIFRAVAAPGGAGFTVEVLPEAVNAPGSRNADPYVAPDESYVIFASMGRPDGLGSYDLYVSFRVDGQWQPARSLGPAINSDDVDFCPMISPDGRYFFFSSPRMPELPAAPARRSAAAFIDEIDSLENGLGNVYWMTSDFLEAMRTGGAPP